MRFLKKNKGSALFFGGGIVAALSLFGASQVVPSPYESFAVCLEEQGAKFYGAFWCSHCQEQKQRFGSAKDKLPYVECSTSDGQQQLDVCRDAGITSYPTWKFADGSELGGTQSMEALAEATGCTLPS